MSLIGERIKSIRLKNNLTQKEFSDRILITQSYLSRIERGSEQPTDILIKLIALEFNISFDWLRCITDDNDLSLDVFDRTNTYNTTARVNAVSELQTLLDEINAPELDSGIYCAIDNFIRLTNLRKKNLTSKDKLIALCYTNLAIDVDDIITRFENINTKEDLQSNSLTLNKMCHSSADWLFDELFSIYSERFKN